MIIFILNHENLIERQVSENLKIKEASDDETIQHCIDLFNSEINWDGMFNLNTAVGRFEYGHKMYVGYYNDQIFGYCWVKNLIKDRYFIYNVFSKSTDFPRQYGATDMLHLVIKNHTSGTIAARVDDWNTKSIRVFEKLGFKPLDY